MKFKTVLLLAVLLVGVVACVEPNYETGEIKVVEVTNHAFEHNGENAVTIFVGYKDAPQFGFTILKKDLKKGTFIQSKSNSAKNLKADAGLGAEYYTQSKDHDTSASLQIIEYDEQAKMAKIAVAAKLVNLEQEDFKELKITIVDITGEHFEHLTKRHQ